MALVALLTDFGTADWFVGSMKAVMLRVDRRLRIVDITHEIGAGDVTAGAFALASSFRFFPAGTVFLAVVDPGVGSERRALVAKGSGYRFVGPDNGVLSLALSKTRDPEVRVLGNRRYARRQVCPTFHGRDIFAPAAAHLAHKRSLSTFGPEAEGYLRLPWPQPAAQPGLVRGQIVYIDRFGNAITAIEASLLADLNLLKGSVRCSACEKIPLRSFYQQVGDGEPVAVIGSSGYLEIAVNRDNAARRLGLRIGDAVEVYSDKAQ